MTSTVLVETADRVATVILHRPEARNALSSEVLTELPRVIRELDADAGVDVMILTGTDPAFSAGLDLRELGSTGGNLGGGDGERYRGALPPHAKPVIGAVNGPAITGGFELALACDFLIASEFARFADTHARVGVMPGWGLSVLLPRIIGPGRARQMSLTGNQIDAGTALAWGLVNEVVPHGELLARCRQLAADIVGNDQAGVREMRSIYDETFAVSEGEAWDVEARRSRQWMRGFTTDTVADRRQAIIDRGRRQL